MLQIKVQYPYSRFDHKVERDATELCIHHGSTFSIKIVSPVVLSDTNRFIEVEDRVTHVHEVINTAFIVRATPVKVVKVVYDVTDHANMGETKKKWSAKHIMWFKMPTYESYNVVNENGVLPEPNIQEPEKIWDEYNKVLF